MSSTDPPDDHGVPRREDADWLTWWITTARERLIDAALLSELSVEEAAMGFTPADVADFARADVERTRAVSLARRSRG